MSPTTAVDLSHVVLGVHIVVASFIVGGLVVIPLGKWRGWPFVHIFWWRLTHVGVIIVVALQKVLGKICFLTVWEDALLARAGQDPYHMPAIHSWAERLIYWDLPLWFLTVLYLAVLALALWLWRRVPPAR